MNVQCAVISVRFHLSSIESKIKTLLFMLSVRAGFYITIVLCLGELKYVYVVSEALLSLLKNSSKHRVFAFGKEIIVEDLQNNCLQNSPRSLEGMTVLLRLSTTELSHTYWLSLFFFLLHLFLTPVTLLTLHSSSCFSPVSVLHFLLHDLLCLSTAYQPRVILLFVKSLLES